MQAHPVVEPDVHVNGDLGPPTRRSVDDALAAQMREREAFTLSTGVRLTLDGLIRHGAVRPLEHD